MTAPLYIIGAGGFGREALGIARALARLGVVPEPAGFFDDAASPADLERVRLLGSEVIGSIDDLAGTTVPCSAVIAIGSPSARRAVDRRLASSPVTFPALVHPDATLGADVTLGPGTIIAPGARLSTDIAVGRHVHVDQNVTVGHDARLADYCRLNPQACISGSVTVGSGALVGANATVLQGLEIGAGATVGAGAVVTRSVEPNTTVVGVPAR